MSGYKKSLILILLLIFSGCSSKNINSVDNESLPHEFKTNEKIKQYELEAPYIMFALEYENQKRFFDAASLYKKLFEQTNNYEYFLKYLSINFQFKSYKVINQSVTSDVLKDIENLKEEETILRIYSYSLFKDGKKDDAFKIAETLIEKYKKSVNYDLLGGFYLDEKNYAKSHEMYEISYSLSGLPAPLMTLSNIEYFYLLDKKSAKKRLEDFVEEKEYNYTVCLQLLVFYEKDKEFDKILELLEEMHDAYKIGDDAVALNNTNQLYLRYLIQKDVNKAIEFAIENDMGDEVLLSLYKMSNQMVKAKELLEKMYADTNNLDYLAQIAIIEFETAPIKTAVLDSVMAKFDKALEEISNPVYENYYAYLLIDFDINYEKGILLVKKALEKEPENLAYMDTFAWGAYKLKNCAKAYEFMKIIVDKVGLNDDEIKLHWEKIKECSK